MFAFLNVNKPAGQSSRRVVDQIQQLVAPAKAGHAGTLDPLATGVLVVAIGDATRLVPYVQRLRKAYRATFLLGRRSDTDDVEGAVEMLPEPPRPAESQVRAALKQFEGQIRQRPPRFSAVKVRGRRAYQLARQGHEVELSERVVTVYDAQLVEFHYPQLVVDLTCGSGTYIRALGRDLAEYLGTGAVMSALVRTSIGPFTLDDAVDIAQLCKRKIAEHGLPPLVAVQSLPRLKLTAEEIDGLFQGRFLQRPGHGIDREAAAIDPLGQLVSIVQSVDRNRLKPVRNFKHR